MDKPLADTPAERREYFRIDDFIALQVERLDADQIDVARAAFSARRNGFTVANSLARGDDKRRRDLSRVRQKHPEIVAYIRDLEDRIARLMRQIEQNSDDFPTEPTHFVNLSGNGIRFTSEEAIPAGDYLSFKLMLFPSLTRIMTLGKSVGSCADDGPHATPRRHQVRAVFTDILDEDREMLVKHVLELQRQQLRARQD